MSILKALVLYDLVSFIDTAVGEYEKGHIPAEQALAIIRLEIDDKFPKEKEE